MSPDIRASTLLGINPAPRLSGAATAAPVSSNDRRAGFEISMHHLTDTLAKKFQELRGQLRANPTFLVLEVDEGV